MALSGATDRVEIHASSDSHGASIPSLLTCGAAVEHCLLAERLSISGGGSHAKAELHQAPARITVCGQRLPSPSAQVDVSIGPHLEWGDRQDEDRRARLLHDRLTITPTALSRARILVHPHDS